MKLLSVLSTSFDNISRLIVKAWNGKSDTRTAKQYAPYGVDSNPIKGMVAIYGKTELDGAECIIAYLNKSLLADTGECRIFSTDANGGLQTYIWLKNSGNIMELGGNSNNAVKYNEFKTENDKLKSTVNNLITKWNAFTSSYAPGGPSNVGTPPTLAGQNVPSNTSDFSLAKNAKIKTI